MSLDTSMMNWCVTIGMQWFCITSDWTISGTSQVRRGRPFNRANCGIADCRCSAFMLPKQVEMDGVVERIYTAIEKQPHLRSALFILAGDHGMNDAGNHGGSGEGETSPALVFMSPKLKKAVGLLNNPPKAPAVPNNGDFGFYSTIEQSDLAPTITSLLGLPIPKNNLGVTIPALMKMWDGMR
jgi:hypothetical protein